MTLQATIGAEKSVQDDVVEIKPKTKAGRPSKPSEEHFNHLDKLTYLIVDDSRFNRKMVREALSLFGVRHTIEAKDAVQALQILEKDHIDLVLTDYEMPMMTGVELTRMIRRSKEVKNSAVPILIISGYTEEYRLQEAIAAGIEEYVVKPFAPDKLLCHVVRALGVAHPALLAAS